MQNLKLYPDIQARAIKNPLEEDYLLYEDTDHGLLDNETFKELSKRRIQELHSKQSYVEQIGDEIWRTKPDGRRELVKKLGNRSEKKGKYAYFILGVNGGGKSTFRDYQLNIQKDIKVIDPDKIAKQFNLTSVSAGKRAIALFQRCLTNGDDFLFEGTLSDTSMLKRINRAKEHDYIIKAYFIGLDSCELHKARVAQRVLNGGHYIDPIDIERRYLRSLNNIKYLFQLADQLKIIDNTKATMPHDLCLLIIRNKIIKQYENRPDWVEEYVLKPFHQKSIVLTQI